MATETIPLASEELAKRHEEIRLKLTSVKLPDGKENNICTGIAFVLNISMQTVKNYLSGKIGDGFLAEAIYKEFKKLKFAK